ncbi:hypothetical protein CHELA20_10865 [Hyphomicrobiales bacterium]|nr:hypothetical protein CHELA20_10865 [Hyphomicrobiales bacterium]CAH1694035.1 hypothetical protein CHELA41_51096 [Hyphomicrobiales bacterium]
MGRSPETPLAQKTKFGNKIDKACYHLKTSEASASFGTATERLPFYGKPRRGEENFPEAAWRTAQRVAAL